VIALSLADNTYLEPIPRSQPLTKSITTH